MSINTKKIYHLSGLSTDTKPIPDDIATGSTFLETDSGITFVYNRGTNQWIPTQDKVEPTVVTPCLGILSIELTSRAGLVDTYTIRYTNGSSTTFNVTNGGYITPNIDEPNPIISDKIYSLDINTDKYELYKVVRLNSVYSGNPDVVKSEVINYKKFWPRLDEGKFILAVTADTDLVFNYVGTYDGVETWQAVEVANVDTIIRYIGHFEYIDNNNQNSSNYYFVAARQTLSIGNIESRLNDEITRSEAVDNELAEELDRTTTGLTEEITRAQNAELELLNKIDSHQEDYEALNERVSVEETRAIAQDLELETKIEQEIEDREAEADTKVDRVNFDQEIVANKLDTRSMVLFDNNQPAIDKKVATIEAKVAGANKTLAIYQEVAEDQQIPVEKINVNALDTEITGDLQLDGSVKGTLNLDYITDEYLDDLFPLELTEEKGE